MKVNLVLISILFSSFFYPSYSQSVVDRYKHLGELNIVGLSTAPFPHPVRINGHRYKDKIYPAKTHYSDSSVAIFIPKDFRKTPQINIVIYFHGWNNTIDSSLIRFKLLEQFSQSNKNAIFIFPEGPKNAPDSHGGKLEEKDGLKNLVNDVLVYLSKSGKIDSSNIGKITLSGHSGAYRVITFCLDRGGLTNNISDVLLFDALYGRSEKYLFWIKNYTGRFINIFTNNGGTKGESENLMATLDSLNLPYFKTKETDLKENDLSRNRLIFIHTKLNHNEVISERKQFQNFLSTSVIDFIDNKR